MALVLIIRERTVRLRKAYLVDMDADRISLLKATSERDKPDEFIDNLLEPYYTQAIATSADEIIEVDGRVSDRNLVVAWTEVDADGTNKEG